MPTLVRGHFASWCPQRRGAPGSPSGYVKQARWDAVSHGIAVPNLEIALAGEGTRIYSGAVELVSQQAEHLGRWIIDRYRQEGLDMVVIVYVTSEDRIAKLALRSNAGFTESPNVRSFRKASGLNSSA